MSLFKSSADTGKQPRAKILLWGPPGSGKTHFALGAPRPALLDLENRGRSFASRSEQFAFAHAEIGSLADLGTAYKEVRAGAIDCDSIVVDSASAIYYMLVSEHTARTERGAYVTDWVTVNRRFLDCLNFVFGQSGKNVLFTAHAATKLVREGRDFRAAGLKFVGDERFRFGFDYIFRLESKGDPTVTPAAFHVEKTSSPALKVGSAIAGLTWPQFAEMTRSVPAAKAPASSSASQLETDGGTAITDEQRDRIEVLAHAHNLGQLQLGDYVKKITRRTPLYQNMTASEAQRMIVGLEAARAKGAM